MSALCSEQMHAGSRAGVATFYATDFMAGLTMGGTMAHAAVTDRPTCCRWTLPRTPWIGSRHAFSG